MKHNSCFDCLNHAKGELAENTGWHHPCKLGIENEGLSDLSKCEKYEPNQGFQIGGYYTQMHFEGEPSRESNACLEWVIHGNGEFPTKHPSEFLRFHLCDFTQLEEWVKFWGIELRKRGLVVE